MYPGGPWDPTAVLYLGPYGCPRGWALFIERNTPVGYPTLCCSKHMCSLRKKPSLWSYQYCTVQHGEALILLRNAASSHWDISPAQKSPPPPRKRAGRTVMVGRVLLPVLVLLVSLQYPIFIVIVQKRTTCPPARQAKSAPCIKQCISAPSALQAAGGWEGCADVHLRLG